MRFNSAARYPRARAGVLVGALALLALGTRPSWAQEFPQIDVRQVCANAADPHSCEQIEHDARNRLMAVWGGLTSQKKGACRATAYSQRSYMAALGCATGY